MKLDRLLSILAGGSLAFLMALGGIGGFAQAFDLNYDLNMLTFWAAAAALGGAILFSFRRGGTVVLCVLALLAGYFWRQGDLFRQIMVIAYRVSRVYDSAYGCGVVIFSGDQEATVTLALCVLSGLTTLLCTFSVCRRRILWLAIPVGLLPLGACLAVTNVVPESRYLYLLLLGLALLLLTQSVRRRSSGQAARLTVFLAVPTALALTLLFLLIPRDGYAGQERAERLSNSLLEWGDNLPFAELEPDGSFSLNLSGTEPSTIHLRSIGPKFQSSLRVMEVTAETGGSLYLREQDFDVYDGTKWTSVTLRSETFPVDPIAITLEDAGDVTIRTLRNRNCKYIPYYPAGEWTLAGGKLVNQNDETRYTISRRVLPEDWKDTAEAYWQEMERNGVDLVFPIAAEAEMDTLQNARHYTMLPEETRQWAEEYLDTHLTSDFSNHSAILQRILIAEAIADLVRQSAAYDLDTPRMPTDKTDFARWFLESSDTGYCVHFATATAVLLRAAGIEARYVEGYLISAQPNQTITVTSQSAHAWVEYYVPDIGWLVLESTGAPEATPVWLPEEEDSTAGQASTPATQPTDPTPEEHSQSPALYPATGIAAGILCLITVILQWRLRIVLRRKRQRTGGPNQRALAKWQEIRHLFRLLKQAPPAELEELALQAGFSQHTLTADELSAFDRCRNSAIRHLRSRPLPVRLYHRLFRAAY